MTLEAIDLLGVPEITSIVYRLSKRSDERMVDTLCDVLNSQTWKLGAAENSLARGAMLSRDCSIAVVDTLFGGSKIEDRVQVLSSNISVLQ